jgi:Cu/Ag efflux pump CusA
MIRTERPGAACILSRIANAALGLLPAALSTRVGAQTQRPLAIVALAVMILMRLLPPY